MALHFLRVRRALATVSSLHRSLPSTIPSIASSPLLEKSTPLSSSLATIFCKPRSFSLTRVSFFSSSPSTRSSPPRVWKEGEEITPDMVLFEGCDYNHWLITVDFPKEAKPPPEEMVRTYEEICAKGLNISLDEAKKRMYACSTTTYEGFQAIMTEEESEKFRDIPQVVFVLPDSYIDPVNKEYGGDKYENGVITHRPPPVQYHRTSGRFRDQRNRNADRGRYDQRGGQAPNQQGYNQQGDGRNYGASQNYSPQQNYPPQQNYGPPQQNYSQPQQNFGPPRQHYSQPQQNFGPPQQNYSQPRQNYDSPPQQNYGPPQQNYSQPRQNYDGPPQQNHSVPQQNYSGFSDQESKRGPMPSSHQGNHPQGGPTNNNLQEQREFPQGSRREYAPPGQGGYAGDNRDHGQTQGQMQGANPDYGQGFSHVEQRNAQREQRNYMAMGQTGPDQGRY
ncbi:multiple organellar RNA editing factor 1, mitochondrial-like [Tripterygium wilfordii]|uniref:multiple organellar RNA editing factor 1, mitochondrial-like n=1 Tax=Tripterygium wilfordii TaxID=458696 RepID=UPI0018F83114|nr:multiple organellar RNA editing factor 1, mitochondrial-like [Tripterygium wilfordii]